MSNMTGFNLDADGLENSYPDTDYKGQVANSFTQDAKEAETVSIDECVPSEIASRIDHDLYTHQARALSDLEVGENVCVSTSTSSGKTLVYALQIAKNYLENPSSTALIVYPTKALSRDQEQSLNELYEQLDLDITVGVYDGDTDQKTKRHVRNNANIIITNFSGVNAYLPHHDKWSRFFTNLDVVAIDESHTYTGIHGMHVAWTIRRLKRVLNYYEASPQFILTSATIGNPQAHSYALTGETVHVISRDGSPHGKREIVFWNPPSDDDEDSYGQRPANIEASEVLAHLAYNDVQSMLFTSSRKLTELNSHRAEEQLNTYGGGNEVDIEPYHAGHGQETRRDTEKRLKNGDLDGVATTSALELGMDVGGIDSVILAGYPGTRQSFWQRIGRAGRSGSDSLGVFVGDYDSIDQYLMKNPEYLLEDAVEDAVVDLENNQVYAKHILCAATELGLTWDDASYFGGEDRLQAVVEMWRRAGEFTGDLDTSVQYSGAARPQTNISMYASSDEQVEIMLHDDYDGSLDIEPVDKERAYRDFHYGAVYMHKGRRYQVVKFDTTPGNAYAVLKPADEIDYYTRTVSSTEIHSTEAREHRTIGPFDVYWGTGSVTVHYDSYNKVSLEDNSVTQQSIPTQLPPITMETQMMWVDVPSTVEKGLISKYQDYTTKDMDTPFTGYIGGVHALEHGMIGVAPLELMMEKQDLGGLSTYGHPTFTSSGFFIYDGVSGGLGFSKTIFDEFESVAQKTKEVITTCECDRPRGCPACVMDEYCGNNNRPLHKQCAVDIIDLALETRPEQEILPQQEHAQITQREILNLS